MSATNRNAILLNKLENSECLHAADDRIRWENKLFRFERRSAKRYRAAIKGDMPAKMPV
jgi:hypothetical protein